MGKDGKSIYGLLWMTRKWIMALPMSNCLTYPILWRRRITLELDYLPVILELQFIHYERLAVLLWSISLAFIYSLSWWRHQMETLTRHWSSVRVIHRSLMNSPHTAQWREAMMFSLICDWANGWVNNRDAGDLRPHRPHYDVRCNGNWFKWLVDHKYTITI